MKPHFALPTLHVPAGGAAWLARTGPTASGATRLANELASFEPIGLNEMAAVALLDRIDTKYVLRTAQLASILPALRAHYRVLEIKGCRPNPYRTLYFDTRAFELYRWHQSGRRVRHKVRSREYLNSGRAFFEVKHRTGPSHTHKERFATEQLLTDLTPDAYAFLRGRLPLPASSLEPKLWVDYTRVTLVSRYDQERLTLDFDLRFWGDGRSLELPGMVTAEVKHVGRPRASVFIQLMRQYIVRPRGFSKYCIGASLLYPELKSNRFKRNLRLIGQFQQGDML